MMSAFCAAGAQNHGKPADERKVVVQARDYRAVVTAWERRGSEWSEVMRTEDAFVGEKGITEKKGEGDKATPAGTYELRRAFGLGPAPLTALPYTQVAENDIWVDDPHSRFYNQYVAGGADLPWQWSSAEQLAAYDTAYRYAVVIEYNTDPIVPGAGSAIFLHCSTYKPTAGCVSVPEEFMVRLLEFLRPGDKITIQDFDGNN